MKKEQGLEKETKIGIVGKKRGFSILKAKHILLFFSF